MELSITVITGLVLGLIFIVFSHTFALIRHEQAIRRLAETLTNRVVYMNEDGSEHYEMVAQREIEDILNGKH